MSERKSGWGALLRERMRREESRLQKGREAREGRKTGGRPGTLGPERCIVENLASSNVITMTVEFNRLLYSCPIDYLH